MVRLLGTDVFEFSNGFRFFFQKSDGFFCETYWFLTLLPKKPYAFLKKASVFLKKFDDFLQKSVDSRKNSSDFPKNSDEFPKSLWRILVMSEKKAFDVLKKAGDFLWGRDAFLKKCNEFLKKSFYFLNDYLRKTFEFLKEHNGFPEFLFRKLLLLLIIATLALPTETLLRN